MTPGVLLPRNMATDMFVRFARKGDFAVVDLTHSGGALASSTYKNSPGIESRWKCLIGLDSTVKASQRHQGRCEASRPNRAILNRNGVRLFAKDDFGWLIAVAQGQKCKR